MKNKKSGKLSLATILSYGMAYGSGYQIMGSLVGSYLMIFFTDTFGIPAAAAGVIMVLASIWDAINDPIMGVLADKTHTRFGKFRPYLEEKLGSFIFQMIDFRLKSFDEKIIPEAQKENELTMKYDALIAGAEIDFRGKTYNLPQMGKFMQDLDRETRKEASKAYYGYLSTIEDQIEDIYDQLVKVRDQMAKKLGFKNYVELGYIKMGRYDYTPEMVASYREQIREYVTPVAAKILKEQFKRTGIKNPHIYDTGLEFMYLYSLYVVVVLTVMIEGRRETTGLP